MAIVEKKIWPGPFERIVSGEKRYELRLDDFEINEGDTLLLREWDPRSKEYTGRQLEKRVKHISDFKISDLPWSQEEIEEKGLKIISIN